MKKSMISISETSISSGSTLAEKLNDSSIDRVMAIDTSWKIIAWNKTSEELSGHLRKDIMGKNLLEIFPVISDDEEMMEALHQAFNGRKSFLPSSHGRFNRHYIENHFIPLYSDSEEILGVMNIMHDVAHRVKAEKQLIKLNAALEKKYIQLEKANNDLAIFTGVAGRDIKEPIRNVYTALEILARNEGQLLSNSSRGNLRKMQASLNRINLLLDDMLTVATIGQYDIKFTQVDLNTVVEEVKQKITEKLDAPVTINSANLPLVKGSHELIAYLLQQLFENAIKFQRGDNQPVINIKFTELTTEDITGNTEALYEISISDNGIGFDQSDAERIFNMFERLHKDSYRGSGIGLTICKKIMEKHDGSIVAESVQGIGTTLKCYFPALMNKSVFNEITE